jgi:hypothetical protein
MNRRNRNVRLAAVILGLAGVALGLTAGPAAAAPSLELQLKRNEDLLPITFPSISRSDERVDYTVNVKNSVPTGINVGEQLTCNRDTWTNEATIGYAFAYQWVANGVSLGAANGAQSTTYTIQPADAGKVIQCTVIGTNPANNSAYTLNSQSSVDIVVNPTAPAEPPTPKLPTNSGRRPAIAGEAKTAGEELTCTAPTSEWNGFATAKTTSGSASLTEVVTAAGTATLTAGSKNVSGVTTTRGVFAVGQTISGTGIPASTAIAAVGAGTLELSAAATVSGSSVALSAGAQPFAVGQPIAGAGIPAAIGTGTLTSGSATVTAIPSTSGAFVAGQTIKGTGIPTGTTILAASGTTTQTLTLSAAATASGTGVGLSANTTVAAVSGQTVTLSSAATATASGVAITGAGTAVGSWTFRWLRNGVQLPGFGSGVYPSAGEVTAEAPTMSRFKVAGSELIGPSVYQCLATATNTQGAVLTESGQKNTTGTTAGTANTETASNLIKNVVTTTGTGNLTAGSKTVSGLTTTTGVFLVGQTVAGAGVPVGATVAAVGPGSLELSAAAEASGSGVALSAGPQLFAVGQTITGPGIPTTTATGTGTLVAGSKNVTAVTTATGTFHVGDVINGTGVTAYTTVAAVGAGTLELSRPALASGSGVALTATIGVTAISGQSLVLSAPATATATGITVNQSTSTFITSSNTLTAAGKPAIITPAISNSTTGTVTAELELPGGSETFAFSTSATGWSCDRIPANGAQHARVLCTRSNALQPQESFPPINVITALGADAPDTSTAKALAFGGGTAALVTAEDQFTFAPLREFGLSGFEATLNESGGVPSTQAGGHPLEGTATFPFIGKRRLVSGGSGETAQYAPIEQVKQVFTDLPRGQVANALAVPELCPGFEANCEANYPGSRVGLIKVDLGGTVGIQPIFSLEPEFGTAAQFAFKDPPGNVYTISARLRADDGYAITLETAPAPPIGIMFAKAQICNFGVKGSETAKSLACKLAGEADPDGAGPLTGGNPVPLFTNPTRCGQPAPVVAARLNSWEHPDVLKHYEFTTPEITGCDHVHFEPEVNLEPTNHQADSPTGLNVSITMPTEGLEDPFGISQANLDNAVVKFPEGMSINPASADGLGACTEAQVKPGSNADDECPASSKVGTVEIKTPLIKETLTGNVYVAKQNANPFKSTLGLYMVFSSKKDGITIKVAGKLVTDPVTGQLTSVFTENPEDPFSRLTLKFNSGPRAPLINPPKCGSYAIKTELSPWSAASPANPTPEEISSSDSTFEVTEGPNGGACPSGNLDPKLKAGLQNPQAGSKSTFNLTLSREDGTQRFTGLNVNTPKGLTAYLKGTPYCPDSVLAGISSAEETGGPQLANPSCPAASQVGTVLSGAGAGPYPFEAPGKVYLAGPYKGAPVSLAVVAPAVAGPFDLGNVVIRNGLYINPETAQVTAKSDPIPTILHGILLDVRQIRLALDKPNFTAAPTNCESQQVVAQVKGEQGGTAAVAVPFGVSGCENLAFKPKLALRLFGGTHRSAHPRLVAKLTYPPGSGYANIAGASVALPHSEFLDQAHIRTVCTRVQFAAHQCPQGAIYGHAEAVTPLLDNPVSGPVYLRSSDNPLPDLVAALRGPDNQPIEVVLDGRVDSVHGGIRSTFEAVPDQPVSSFTLNMQGGKKGLLVNSRDICKSVNKANAVFTAQNGRTTTLRPVLQNSCGKAAKKHKRHR